MYYTRGVTNATRSATADLARSSARSIETKLDQLVAPALALANMPYVVRVCVYLCVLLRSGGQSWPCQRQPDRYRSSKCVGAGGRMEGAASWNGQGQGQGMLGRCHCERRSLSLCITGTPSAFRVLGPNPTPSLPLTSPSLWWHSPVSNFTNHTPYPVLGRRSLPPPSILAARPPARPPARTLTGQPSWRRFISMRMQSTSEHLSMGICMA